MELESFVFSAVVLLIATSVTVALFRQIGLGSVLGLLVAGMIVGPYTPGPHITAHVEDVRQFTEFGVVLLLFLIGLEIKPARLWKLRREVLGLGSLQILLSGIAIAAYFSLYQSSWRTALFIGLTLALSSTAFVMQILRDRGDFASRHGSTTFSVLLMQDLAIVPLLAAVPILSDTGPLPAEIPHWKQIAIVVGMFGLIGALGKYLMPVVLERLARQGNREAFLLVVMLAVFLSAWVTHKAGLSMALGAFLMGMFLSESHYNLQIQAYIEPYKGLLISIFFVAIGMSIDIGMIAQRPATFAQHAIAIVVIKVAVMFLLGLFFGLPRDVNARVSSLLAQGGEFGFVLLGSARALKVIDQETFVLTIGVISVSMLATPLLVRLGDAVARRFEEQQPDDGSIYHADKGEVRAKVIIGGYGRVGHIVATLLHSSGVPFIAFDRNPASVAKGKADGYPVYFGDISDPDLLAAVRVEQASLVVLTVDQVETAIRAASHIGTAYPHVPVIARARDLEASGRLLEAGATVALPELVESSLYLAANALEMVGVPGDNVDLLLQGVRDRSYALVRQAGDVVPQA